MRIANLIGFFFGCLWLGGCIALGVSAAILFRYANISAIDVTTMQLGELFGHIFNAWTYIGLGCLGLIVVARLSSWSMLALQRRIGAAQIFSMVVLAALVVITLATARTTWAAQEAYQTWDSAGDEAKAEASAVFNEAHIAARKRSNLMFFALVVVVGNLAFALARRDQDAASAPTRAA